MIVNSDLLFFESCNTSWCFDAVNHRFKRIPRPLSRQATFSDFSIAAWEEYFELTFSQGSDEFTVMLNESGSKVLRSWRHSENCSHCFKDTATYSTEEISLSGLNNLLGYNRPHE